MLFCFQRIYCENRSILIYRVPLKNLYALLTRLNSNAKADTKKIQGVKDQILILITNEPFIQILYSTPSIYSSDQHKCYSVLSPQKSYIYIHYYLNLIKICDSKSIQGQI